MRVDTSEPNQGIGRSVVSGNVGVAFVFFMRLDPFNVQADLKSRSGTGQSVTSREFILGEFIAWEKR